MELPDPEPGVLHASSALRLLLTYMLELHKAFQGVYKRLRPTKARLVLLPSFARLLAARMIHGMLRFTIVVSRWTFVPVTARTFASYSHNWLSRLWTFFGELSNHLRRNVFLRYGRSLKVILLDLESKLVKTAAHVHFVKGYKCSDEHVHNPNVQDLRRVRGRLLPSGTEELSASLYFGISDKPVNPADDITVHLKARWSVGHYTFHTIIP